jgi:hypothetical protein
MWASLRQDGAADGGGNGMDDSQEGPAALDDADGGGDGMGDNQGGSELDDDGSSDGMYADQDDSEIDDEGGGGNEAAPHEGTGTPEGRVPMPRPARPPTIDPYLLEWTTAPGGPERLEQSFAGCLERRFGYRSSTPTQP